MLKIIENSKFKKEEERSKNENDRSITITFKFTDVLWGNDFKNKQVVTK